jgi:hypothetical protein
MENAGNLDERPQAESSNSNKSYYAESNDDFVPKTPSPESKIPSRNSLKNLADPKSKRKFGNDGNDGGSESKRAQFESPGLGNMFFGGAINKFKEGESVKSSFISSPSIMNVVDYNLIQRPRLQEVRHKK